MPFSFHVYVAHEEAGDYRWSGMTFVFWSESADLLYADLFKGMLQYTSHWERLLKSRMKPPVRKGGVLHVISSYSTLDCGRLLQGSAMSRSNQRHELWVSTLGEHPKLQDLSYSGWKHAFFMQIFKMSCLKPDVRQREEVTGQESHYLHTFTSS